MANRVPLLLAGAAGSAIVGVVLLVTGSGVVLYGVGSAKANPTQATAGEQPAGDEESGEIPTETEIRETIERVFHETYYQDYGFAKVASATFEISNIQIGKSTLVQVEYGKDAQPVIPVRAIVKVHVTYSNNSSDRNVTRGESTDDTFLFYRNAFGKWTFKTGAA
jgi:hypothetical protein